MVSLLVCTGVLCTVSFCRALSHASCSVLRQHVVASLLMHMTTINNNDSDGGNDDGTNDDEEDDHGDDVNDDGGNSGEGTTSLWLQEQG